MIWIAWVEVLFRADATFVIVWCMGSTLRPLALLLLTGLLSDFPGWRSRSSFLTPFISLAADIAEISPWGSFQIGSRVTIYLLGCIAINFCLSISWSLYVVNFYLLKLFVIFCVTFNGIFLVFWTTSTMFDPFLIEFQPLWAVFKNLAFGFTSIEFWFILNSDLCCSLLIVSAPVMIECLGL